MRVQIDDKEFDLMLEYDQIKKRTRLLGIQLNLDYENKVPIFIGVLNGSFLFMADLVKEINVACEMAFLRVSSYKGDSSTGIVREVIGLDIDISGRDIIIVEDIVDTGLTLSYLIKQLKEKEPASINVCSLLYKPTAIQEEIEELSYVGFEIANEFVVGYGLDYNGLGRNLKDIYRVSKVPSET
jgi:hypoxanthine phosphoribosyltransferase